MSNLENIPSVLAEKQQEQTFNVKIQAGHLSAMLDSDLSQNVICNTRLQEEHSMINLKKIHLTLSEK